MEAQPAPAHPPQHALRSFWMGGYEGADHVNSQSRALDMAQANGHADQFDEDYRLAARAGLRTVRESVGWRLSEPSPHRYEFERMMQAQWAARRQGVQILWTLMHYGTPADLNLFDDELVGRFTHFARAVARTLRPLSETPPVYTLINEINFVAWAVSETRLIQSGQAPDDAHDRISAATASTLESGYDVKRRLVRATLSAMAAVREVDPRARFLQVEPVVHVVAPQDQPQMQSMADHVRSFQWQAWDMIAGHQAPELGGHPEALDLIGVNHYHNSQWEVGTEQRLWWHLRDPRRLPLSQLLHETWQRYRRPLIVAETSHVGEGRAAWFHEVACEVLLARRSGVPVQGVCLYPVVDRPDWDDNAHWHRSGLWDVAPASHERQHGPLRGPCNARVMQPDYAAALAHWQARLQEEDVATRRALSAHFPAGTP